MAGKHHFGETAEWMDGGMEGREGERERERGGRGSRRVNMVERERPGSLGGSGGRHPCFASQREVSRQIS